MPCVSPSASLLHVPSSSAAVHFAHCASQANQIRLAHHCSAGIFVSHKNASLSGLWSSDSASPGPHLRRSKPDIECATTCESPAAPVIAPQCPESTSTSVTTTLDPTVRTNSVSAITTLQASISPSDCVSRGRSLIHHRPLALPRMCLRQANELLGGYASSESGRQTAAEQLLEIFRYEYVTRKRLIVDTSHGYCSLRLSN